MSARRNIEEFLAEVATRDLKQVLGHSYVFPKDDVAVRIREEVAAKTGCKVTGNRDHRVDVRSLSHNCTAFGGL
jgi:hypothetical protein